MEWRGRLQDAKLAVAWEPPEPTVAETWDQESYCSYLSCSDPKAKGKENRELEI